MVEFEFDCAVEEVFGLLTDPDFIVKRSLALGDLEVRDVFRACKKEILVAVANGLAVGAVAAIGAYAWQQNWALSSVLAAALWANPTVRRPRVHPTRAAERDPGEPRPSAIERRCGSTRESPLGRRGATDARIRRDRARCRSCGLRCRDLRRLPRARTNQPGKGRRRTECSTPRRCRRFAPPSASRTLRG